jgi:hypothetical protein
MKKSLVIAMSLLLVSVVQGAGDDDSRTFTSTDGRTMEARILEYDSGRNLLKIERADGKKL